ncbi:MAG: TIGR00730 family Rossman fold protein [Candidatus Methylomirabilota bacterium]
MRTICVFCGARPGRDPDFAEAARRFGGHLARSGRTLVYGGGHVGMMGILADAALAGGGRVIGVIPRTLADKALAHPGLSELRVVESMHERKALMAELSDGFVALPGGIGTLEELFEIWTWGQLGLHRKPYGLLEVNGFYRPLLAFLDSLVPAGFVHPEHRETLAVDSDPEALLRRMATLRPAQIPKWLDSPPA